MPRFYVKSSLVHDAVEHIYRLTELDGTVTEFDDFTGMFVRRIFPGGNTITVTAMSTNGANFTEVERIYSEGGNTITEQFNYDYINRGDLLLGSVTLRRKINSGSWNNVLRTVYDYYGFEEAHGNQEDLKTATNQEWDGSDWRDIGTYYYRYYKHLESGSSSSSSSANEPAAYLLKYILNPAAFSRLAADPAISDPLTASDAQVAQYADFYYEYDAQKRVTLERTQGGTQTFTFEYFQSTFADDVNAWKYKTIETLPDGNQNIVYCNYATQPILSIFKADSDEWYTFSKYDSSSNLILQANSSAISGYEEQYPDLLHEESGQYEYLRDDAGLIHTHTYHPPTNWLASSFLQEGQLGTPIKQLQREYVLCGHSCDSSSSSSSSSPGSDVYFLSKEIAYPSAANPSETIETQYCYTWHEGTCQVKEKTTILPVIGTDQNGSGTSNFITEYFDIYGYKTWSMDERGYITRIKYDIPTGAIVQQINDVNTSIETDHPPGWSTPGDGGLNLVTDYEHDDRGRITQVLGPVHEIDLNGVATNIRRASWMIYAESASQNTLRLGQGYSTGSSPSYSYTLINPVTISISDKNGKIREEIQATRASTAGKLLPSDTFAQSSYTRWHTYQYTNCCQVLSERSYFDIPTTGEGLKSTHYAETSYRYDDRKRRIATISPGGTINRVVYDPRGLILSTWIGTNETGATPSDPTGGGASGNNMVIITANQYDNGSAGGDGNLTQSTAYADATDTRVTTYAYDFRNRRIVTDGEIDYYQTMAYDNLNRVIKTERYNTTSTGNLLARHETFYDPLSRVYRTIQYGVNPATGTLEGGTLTDNNYYNPVGNLLKREPSDIELYREFTYDSLNRLVTETDPRAAETTFTYDVNGQRLTLTDAEGNTTIWSYDGIGRVVKETNELDESRHFSYASSGALASKTDRNGRVTEYTYDDMGRNTSEIWKENSTTVNTITHTYNVESQSLSSSDVVSGLIYTYDGWGRIATASNAETTGVPEVVLMLTHNRLNERTDLAAQIGTTLDFANSYLYDKLGRISQITQTDQTSGNPVANKRIDFTFGSLDYNTGIIRYDNLTTSNLVAATTLNYDPFARLISQTHVKDATTLGNYSITYDAHRRINSMTTPDGLGEFDYDGSGQLLEADYDYQPDEEFSYDLTGNRTMAGYSTGPNNQLLEVGDLEFEYDGEGNRIKLTDTSTDNYIEYAWDHRNRLTKVTFYDDTDTKTKEIFYTYDTHNRRVRKQLDSNGNGTIDSEQRIAYDADWKPGLEDIVLIFNESDDLQHRFLHGPDVDQPLADEQPTQLQWLLSGQLGTIADVVEYNLGTDTTTNINHLIYTSFGQIASQTNSANEPYYTYTAREWDEDAELYYYRARWYDPITGRFVSEDPIGFEGGSINLFQYGSNSPMTFADPSGKRFTGDTDKCPQAMANYRKCIQRNSNFYVACMGLAVGPTLGVEVTCQALCTWLKVHKAAMAVCVASCLIGGFGKFLCDKEVCDEASLENENKCGNSLNRECLKEGGVEPWRPDE